MAHKTHSTYRISDEGKQLILLLSQKLGVNQTSVLEIAIRKLAEREYVIRCIEVQKEFE